MQSVQFSGSVAFQEPSTDGAPGIWELEDALRNQALGKWPTIPATVPDWLKRGPDGALPVDQADYALGKGWFNGHPYPNLFAYMDAAGGTFSRGSDATYFGRDRILRTAGPNVLRLDHDPITGKALGARLEGAGTNLWRVDPKILGLYTADVDDRGTPLRLFTGDGQALPSWSDGFNRFADNVIATASIYAMRGTSRYLMLGFTGATTSTPRNAGFDFDTGTFVYIGNAITASAVDLGEDLWRLSVTLKAVETDASLRGLRVRPYDGGGGNQSYILQPGETVIWGAPQLEVGVFPASYVATVGGNPSTRLADSLSIDRAGTPEGTVVVEAVSPPGDSGVTGNDVNGLFEWNDGSGSNRISVYRRASNRMYMELNVGSPVSVITAPISPTPVGNATRFRVAFSWKEGQLAASLNGEAAAVATGYAGPMPTTSKIYIGCRRANNPAYAWFGTIARLAIFDRAYTPSQLQEMSA